jgi:hypothetical protein
MKTPPSNPDSHWENLVQQARADVGPPADLAALLRTVRQAPVAPREGWAAEFTALFAFGRIIPTCLAGAGACAMIASWQAWDSWQALPWAQLLTTATGGSP